MKRIFLGLVIAGMLAACHGSETYRDQNAIGLDKISPKMASTVPAKIDTANAPVMKFDEDAYAFGKIVQGDSVVHEFKFTNAGKSPLIITDATATCGCTKPEWPKTPINPGQGGIIKVTFHSAGKSGLQDKMVTVTGNTVPSTTMVHLTGEVITGK